LPQQILYFKEHLLRPIWEIGGIATVVILICILYDKHKFRKIEKLKASNKAKSLSKRDCN